MIKDKILTYSEIAAERSVRNMKLEKPADDLIARVLETPIEKVRAIKD